MKPKLWFTEYFTPHEKHSHAIKQYLVRCKTKFQTAIVADTYSFGRCLILDGEMQSAELDEAIYHELLVHPALLLHPKPQSVLVLGGGEGATLREIFKHRTITQVEMVDIDREVVDFCRRYLKKWHQGALASPQAKLFFTDAREYLESSIQQYDVIISDLPSPIEKGPAALLYTQEFYQRLTTKLTTTGLFVLQAGSGDLMQLELHHRIYATLKTVFRYVYPYYQYVPSYDVPWAFILCSQWLKNPLSIDENQINRLITQRITKKLQVYDGVTHHQLFRVSKNLRMILAQPIKIITQRSLCYFFK